MTNASQTSEGEMLNFRKESLTGLDNRNWLINAIVASSSPRCLGTRADRPTHATSPSPRAGKSSGSDR